MGRYLNPPEKLKEIGRHLTGRDYDSLTRQLKDNELLFALGDRGIFFNAPHLFSKEEFNEFNDQYKTGYFISLSFYAVDKATANEYGKF